MKQPDKALSRDSLKRLSKRALSANRARNAFAILAVALTALLLTCVFSIGFSFSKNLATMELRTRGALDQLVLPQPAQEQLEKLRGLPYLRAVGTKIQIGYVQPSAKSSSAVHVVHIDETQWEQHKKPAVSDIRGRLPQAEHEVMLSSRALSLLGMESPREGMEIRLPFSGADGSPFILCGWYTEYTENPDGTALLSGAYCEAHGLTTQGQGLALLSVKKGEENDIVPRLMTDVPPTEEQGGYPGGAERSGPQVSMPVAIAIAVLVLLIALSGYLLIANVLHLSVSRDIRFYGLLKALGAQEKQIRRIVRRQTLLLAAVGIPAGLAAGALACFGVVPYAMRIASDVAGSSAFPAELSFHPLIFLGAALFALLTVLCSCRKPAKIAGRVPPVVALRHTESVAAAGKGKQTARRRGGHRSRLARMAWRNILRDKRRTALVITSMSLGIVLFLSVTSLMDALSGEHYFNAKYPYDFICSVQNTQRAQFNHPAAGEAIPGGFNSAILEADEIQELLEQLQKTDGVVQIDTVRSTSCTMPFDETLWEPFLRAEYLRMTSQPKEQSSMPDGEFQLAEGESYASFVQRVKAMGQSRLLVYSIGERELEAFNRTQAQPMNPGAFRRGETCLIGYGAYETLRGRQLSLTPQATGRSVPLTIGGVFSDQSSYPPDAQIATAQTSYLDGIYISDSLMKRIDPQAAVEKISLIVRPENEPAVKAALKALEMKHQEAFTVSSKSDDRTSQESLIHTMQVLGGGLSILLFLIGLLNFINVMFTGVLTRRREFAVMESIGLTRRQLFSLLAWEGLLNALVTGVISLAASAGVYLLLSKTITTVIPYASFALPYLASACILAALLAVCLLTALVMYRYSARDSVTRRLRETEE